MSYSSYYPAGWLSGEAGATPITPAALNNMERGIREAHPISLTVALPHSGWVDNAQTIEVVGVLEDSLNCHVMVNPNPVSYDGWCEYGVHPSAQGEGTLTFKCKKVPKETLAIDVLIFGGGLA
jgi:hypothetical protein